jgi:hypothetical protein
MGSAALYIYVYNTAVIAGKVRRAVSAKIARRCDVSLAEGPTDPEIQIKPKPG